MTALLVMGSALLLVRLAGLAVLLLSGRSSTPGDPCPTAARTRPAPDPAEVEGALLDRLCRGELGRDDYREAMAALAARHGPRIPAGER
ncbi:hypothetical protein [Actinoplanes teichomyceticus]|uniref:Uncharacterized protein n=1 Tax=Actinoplanes teichomyceticus TaxID=1867 RepID=A0A561VC89_ACTTI|nr:hypothetical protein [Actinoplanes teichomyceticus]TWG09240.1 hypothetical protein FHX34_10939 [Actinoplanes teichomyceticus]GIF17117.1 hypothetical protein Ate01nite_71490 [Actinoplanes teichomyceticus]